MLIKTAIVEDEKEASDKLLSYLDRYSKEHQTEIVSAVFPDGNTFLKNYKADYNIVFMDIQMPGKNGMDVSRELRKIDENVVLIFVTDLAQYALIGYEVDAFDYIVKPVVFEHLCQKLDKLIPMFEAKNNEPKIQIKVDDGVIALNVSSIKYIEIMDHRLFYHTDHGVFSAYGSLSEAEKNLPSDLFVRCNHCYLVNLKFVTGIHGYEVTLGNDRLQISHPKKKGFLEAFTEYLGKNS